MGQTCERQRIELIKKLIAIESLRSSSSSSAPNTKNSTVFSDDMFSELEEVKRSLFQSLAIGMKLNAAQVSSERFSLYHECWISHEFLTTME